MNEEPQERKINNIDEAQLIAVITAAVAAALNSSTHNLVVKDIVRVPEPASFWSKAGRIQQILRRRL